MFADAVEHERLDLGGRHARDAAGFGLSLLQERLRHIVPVAHAELVECDGLMRLPRSSKMRSGQNGRRAPAPDLSCHSVGGELGLHGREQVTVEDRIMLAPMRLVPMDHVADVEPVLEQVAK